MPKIIFTVIILSCILTNCLNAELTAAKLQELDKKLQALLNHHGTKVGVCFIDLKTGRELQINGKKKFPAASVAKIPIMAAAFHLAESGKLDLKKTVLFKEADKLIGSGVLRWMKANREYSLQNLIRLMIVLSDNTATKLVVDQIGYDKINNFLTDIGIKNSNIVDNTMLNEPTNEVVNQTSPADMARLVAMLKMPGYFSPESSAQMLRYMKKQRYRWGIWRGVPKGIEIANKTGNLNGVLNDVGIVYSPAGNYVLSIFTYGFAKKREARELINKISAVVYQTYTSDIKTGSGNQKTSP